MSKRAKFKLYFIFIPGIAVALLTSLNIVSLSWTGGLDPTHRLDYSKTFKQEKFDKSYDLRKSRSLASIDLNNEMHGPSGIQTADSKLENADQNTIKLSCGDPISAVSTRQKFLRITSSFCHGSLDSSMTIRNETSRQNSSVFKTSAKSFSSEYMHLKPGNNILTVSYPNHSGGMQQKVIVTRTLASESE